MAKCDLSIELEEPNRLYTGGDVVRGTVTVKADSDVRCKALEIETAWSTHGRGNIDHGTGQSAVAFQGEWQGGKTYRYPFQLQCARWPPTYHGHYLNVDHYVKARAQIPWGFDPKASQPIQVQAIDGPEAKAARAAAQGLAGKAISGVVVMFLIVLLLIMLINPFLWILAAVVAVGSGIWWFIFRWMPAYRLGPVECRFDSLRLAPGQTLRGELTIQPRRPIPISEVTLKLTATEACVSGSGSNKTTHRHVVFDQQYLLTPGVTLPGGQTTRLPMQIALPETPIYSLDLSDNDLTWNAELRINIPRWPDWKQNETVLVVPPTALQPVDAGAEVAKADAARRATTGDAAVGQAEIPAAALASGQRLAAGGEAVEAVEAAPWGAEQTPALAAAASGQPRGEGITFEETIRHLWSVREDEDQLEMLIEAVQGLPFEVSAYVERRLLYDQGEPAGHRDGHVIWAHYADPPMPLTLYVPRNLGDEFEQAGRDLWRGQGSIIGYDRRHNRVRILVEANSSLFP